MIDDQGTMIRPLARPTLAARLRPHFLRAVLHREPKAWLAARSPQPLATAPRKADREASCPAHARARLNTPCCLKPSQRPSSSLHTPAAPCNRVYDPLLVPIFTVPCLWPEHLSRLMLRPLTVTGHRHRHRPRPRLRLHVMHPRPFSSSASCGGQRAAAARTVGAGLLWAPESGIRAPSSECRAPTVSFTQTLRTQLVVVVVGFSWCTCNSWPMRSSSPPTADNRLAWHAAWPCQVCL